MLPENTQTKPVLKQAPEEPVNWLPAERLGGCSLDHRLRTWLIGKGLLTERLKAVCGAKFTRVERSAYEYAWLPVCDKLAQRALNTAAEQPAGLWARRSRFLLRGAPLLVQELFLPAVGRA